MTLVQLSCVKDFLGVTVVSDPHDLSNQSDLDISAHEHVLPYKDLGFVYATPEQRPGALEIDLS